MELHGVATRDSPLGPERVRLAGTVTYDDGASPPEEMWFDLPRRCAPDLSNSGDAWAAALLPLAVTLGEPLRIPLPLDPRLLEGLAGVNLIWRVWHPHFPVIAVEADRVAPAVPGGRTRGAGFFSGGTDSFFTLLRHTRAAPGAPAHDLDDLLCVWGFDIRLSRPDAFARLRERVAGVADEFGKELVDLATNLRDTRWGTVDWTRLGHGPLLAAVGLVLGPRYHSVLIPSSIWLGSLAPWGSHPFTDPLLSTSATAIVYDGATHTQAQKLELVAGFDVALRSLHVCWESGDDRNCGACRKCLRTMAVLDVLGVLDRCVTFPRGAPVAERLSRIRLVSGADFRTYGRVRDLAVARNRPDIARAIDRCRRRSRRAQRLRAMVDGPAAVLRALRSRMTFP